MKRAIAVDLFCGKGGWTRGLQATGWRVIGFDIERHMDYPGELVLQDVATIDGTRMRGLVDLIVASPPCQAYSYRAMPWKRAKALPPPDNTLFEACFRIAREAGCPLIVENVRGAQKWVGRAATHFGSFYLWGDVPALIPITRNRLKQPVWFNDDKRRAIKCGGDWFSSGENCSLMRSMSSRSPARKEASARIAMIPFDLARWIGEVFYPEVRAGHERRAGATP